METHALQVQEQQWRHFDFKMQQLDKDVLKLKQWLSTADTKQVQHTYEASNWWSGRPKRGKSRQLMWRPKAFRTIWARSFLARLYFRRARGT